MAKVSNKKEEAIKKEKSVSTKLKGSLHPNYREITVEMTNTHMLDLYEQSLSISVGAQ